MYTDVGSVHQMSASDFSQFLIEEVNITVADSQELEGNEYSKKFSDYSMSTDRCIDGKAFAELTREEFAMIYPSKDKFLLASNLSQRVWNQESEIDYNRNTDSLLDELSDLRSTPSTSRSSTPFTVQKRPLSSQPPCAKKTLC